MTLLQFLEDLRSHVIARRDDLSPETRFKDGGMPQQLEVTLGHLDTLIWQAKKPKIEQTRSVILSSWQVVSQGGQRLGLLERYRGDSGLKAELKAWVSGE